MAGKRCAALVRKKGRDKDQVVHIPLLQTQRGRTRHAAVEQVGCYQQVIEKEVTT